MTDQPRDLRAELQAKIADYRGYDELAVDQYLALSHYIALREQGTSQAQAAALVCEVHGHDAPRGRCVRCGLGVTLDSDEQKRRERSAKRDAWLQSRRG